ncbi:MAG: STAS domain-containing protein [Candidatus Zixiibacteriota bacterium]|nr:MAG: STAS domain-containing protein [candidate division Zixibacteria bacterium]
MFDIKISEDGTVFLAGRLDASQAEKARSVLNSLGRSVTVDFSGLDYISSAGLGVFLGLRQRLDEAGHRIKLINMNKHVRDVFRYAGMDQLFEIE